MDFIIDIVHQIASIVVDMLQIVSKICMLQFPMGQELSLVCFIISGCVANKSKELTQVIPHKLVVYTILTIPNRLQDKPVYWLQSLVATILGTFGGGTLIPLMIGRNTAFLTFGTTASLIRSLPRTTSCDSR